MERKETRETKSKKKGFQAITILIICPKDIKKTTPTETHHKYKGNKSVNLGFKKTNDNPREPLKCWGCGEPHLLRNCPYKNVCKQNYSEHTRSFNSWRYWKKYS
jgi:hypothetical protein